MAVDQRSHGRAVARERYARSGCVSGECGFAHSHDNATKSAMLSARRGYAIFPIRIEREESSMKPVVAWIVSIGLVGGVAHAAENAANTSAVDTAEWQTLFDGKTLDG